MIWITAGVAIAALVAAKVLHSAMKDDKRRKNPSKMDARRAQRARGK